MKKLLLFMLLAFALFCSCSEIDPTKEKNEATTEEHIYFNIEILYLLEPNTSYKYTYDKERKIIYFLDENGNIYKINDDGNDKELIFSGEKYDYVFVNNICYCDDFIYFLERESETKGFYRIDPNNGNLSKIEINEDIFGLYDIDQYIICNNEIYLGKLYWGGIWAINLESLELTYYGEIWGNFCFDAEYLYVQSGQVIYKIHKGEKYDENDEFATIDTPFVKKYISNIGQIYLSGEKIFYDLRYEQADGTYEGGPYKRDLYVSNKDGSEAKKIDTGNEFGGILFEKSGYVYFYATNSGYLYRISSVDETIEQVRKLKMGNYNWHVIGDYLYLDERKENNEYNVMRMNIGEHTGEFALEKIDWLTNLPVGK